MWHLSAAGRVYGRQLSLGGGDKKDKLLIAGLAVVIIGAVVALAASIVGGGGPKAAPPPNHIGCVVPGCGWEKDITKEDYEAKMKEIGERMENLATRLRWKCEKCQDKRITAMIMDKCPACGRWYISNQKLRFWGLPAKEPQLCPYCGKDIMKELRAKKQADK